MEEMCGEIIKIKNLDKYFGGLTALDKVNFRIRENRITGLIGPNGAGKTTLFNTICGVYRADGGEIIFHDRPIQDKKPSEIAYLGIARTFQIARPFLDMTVRENVLTGLGRENYRGILKSFRNSYTEENLTRADEILAILELLPRADEEAGNLSLGYKRRLGIARALALEPEVLMLDEPLAGLGTDAIEKMLEIIEMLNKEGKTIIIIEHNMDAVMQICDRVVVLNQGQKIAEGIPAEIQENREVIEAYLGKDDSNAKN